MITKNSKPLSGIRRKAQWRVLLQAALVLSLVTAVLGLSPSMVAKAANAFQLLDRTALFANPADALLVENAAAAWGDFNRDGYLDLVYSGTSFTGPVTGLYAFGGATFGTPPLSLQPVHYGALAVGDYNLDNAPDLLVTGRVNENFDNILTLYRNAGAPGALSLVEAAVTFDGPAAQGLYWGSADWGDYDNDGDPDLLMTGATNEIRPVTVIYRNDLETGTFTAITHPIPGVYKSTADWVDYDNDGWLDVFVAGDTLFSGYTSRLYRNNAGTFVAGPSFDAVTMAASDWGDYDADGYADLLLSGRNSSQAPITRVYRNSGGSFGGATHTLTGVALGSVAWGDFDDASNGDQNDGRLDALVAGVDSDYLLSTRLYRFDPIGNQFVDTGAALNGLSHGAVLPGDYDNDGDLDFAMIGRFWSGGPVQDIFMVRNTAGAADNLPPAASARGTATVTLEAGVYRVSAGWTTVEMMDDKTPNTGLSTNLFVQDESGAFLVSPLVNLATGDPWLPGMGNAGSRPNYLLSGLPHTGVSDCPVYPFGAQVIDPAGEVSPMASLGTFVVNLPPTVPAQNLLINLGYGDTGNLPVTLEDLDGDTPWISLADNPDPAAVDTSVTTPGGTVVTLVDNTFSITAAADVSSDLDELISFYVFDDCSASGAVNAGRATAQLNVRVSSQNYAPTAVDGAFVVTEDTPLSDQLPAVDDQNPSDTHTYTQTGTGPVNGTVQVNSTGSFTYTPNLNYPGVAASGSDSFQYKVTDQDGAESNVATITLTINQDNDAPVFTGVPYSFTIDEDTVLGQAPNPAPLALTSSDVEDNLRTYALDTAPASGTAVVNANGTFTYTPPANFSGPVSFVVRVTEDPAVVGAETVTATVNVQVTAVNDAPTASGPAAQTLNEDTSLTGVGVTFADVENDTLTPQVTDPPDHVANPAAFAITKTGDTTGTFDYVPVANYFGSDSFTFVVNDGTSDSQPVTVNITVNPVADPPIAVDDVDIVIGENSPATLIDVLANDSDPDGTTPTISAVTQPTEAGSGTVTRQNGQVYFQPVTDYNGPATFTYTITDGTRTDTATVRISVANLSDVPVLTDIPDQNIAENLTLGITPEVTDPNPDETFTFTAEWIVNGTPQALPEGAAIDPATGVFTWSVPEGAAEQLPYIFRITVTDSETLTDSDTFVVTVAADVDLLLTAQAMPNPVPAGTTLTYTLSLTNLDSGTTAENVIVTATLPAEVTFDAAASSTQCSVAPGGALTCTVGSLTAGEAITLTVAAQVTTALTESVLLTPTFEATSDQVDRMPANNTDQVTTSVSVTVTVYEGGDTIGEEWTGGEIGQTPTGRTFMGEFNNETVTLTLEDLPAGTVASTVSFDVFILRSWDGNTTARTASNAFLAPLAQEGEAIGPDIWELEVEGGPVLVHSTFTNWVTQTQSFPSVYPGAENPARTGAFEVGSLGYRFYHITEMDSLYHFELSFFHSGSTLVLNFRDLGLQAIEDEAWGLDNVKVTVVSARSQMYTNYLPVSMK